MNQTSASTRISVTALITALAIGSTPAAFAAVSWADVQIGGFVSQGYLVNSGSNDYLGETSEGTFDFREYAVNASYATGPWRTGAQFFGQKLGRYGNDEIKLDWAMVDYQAAQWMGVRAGRVKLPRGLYNESLDVDAVRPFVLLPQSVYDNRLRDFSASFDGGMVYGNVPFGSSGSLDYRLFYGNMPLDTDSGASDYFNIDAPFPNVDIGIESAFGGTLFWNTPVNGLRAGYSFSRFSDFNTVRFVPFRNADAWKTAPRYDRNLISAEYMTGDWVFAAEFGWENVHYEVSYPPAPPAVFLDSKDRYWYVAASRRINGWLELGSYYSYSKFEQIGIGTPLTFPTLKQGDYAVSARFDINDRLLVKVEGHYMDGAGKIFDLPSYAQPVDARDDSWLLLALKSTYSF